MNLKRFSIFLIIFLAAFFAPVIHSAEDGENYKEAAPYKRGQYFLQQRANENGRIPANAYQHAIRQTELMKYKQSGKAFLLAQQPEWRSIGPWDVGGRVRSVVCHPEKIGTVYIGAAAGGVWKTTDFGENWEPLFDYQNSLSFGSIAIDFNNPEILFAGTGEMSDNIDAYLGAGLYRSTDGGDTWKIAGLTEVGGFSKVYVHPQNSDIVVAGATKRARGFYISTDGGENWRRTFHGTVSDVSINPNNPDEYFTGVTGFGIYYSSDGGENWELRNNGLLDDIGRVSVQQSDSNPNIVYALMENDLLGTIYKSTDRGQNWQVVKQPNRSFFGMQNHGFYDNFIEVHPLNPDLAIAGGIILYRTTDGGDNWNIVGGLHVDQHHACFDPIDPSRVYLGNDGGMYFSTNRGNSWNLINNDLMITQFYEMGIDNSMENRNFGGTQDQGTIGNYIKEDQWYKIMGGDGFNVIVHNEDSDKIFVEKSEGDIFLYDLDEQRSYYKNNGIRHDDYGAWNAPFIDDPAKKSRFYLGLHAIYVSENYCDNWTALTERNNVPYSAIGVSLLDENKIIAGDIDGKLIATPDHGDNWHNVNMPGFLPGEYITEITFSHEDTNTAYITYSGYGEPHVFKTTNLGQHWINISEDLPDAPCNDIIIHPDNSKTLFVASDVGVFVSYNDGIDWLPYGRKLPNSPVVDIDFHNNRNILPQLEMRAATHGRSIFAVDVGSEEVDEPAISSPAGGEVFIETTSKPIVWSNFQLPVMVEVSFDGGENWETIAEKVHAGSMLWKIPQTNSMNTRVRINSVDRPDITATSAPFTVKKKMRGDILDEHSVTFTPYGIAYQEDDKSLWITDIHTGNLYQFNSENFILMKKLISPAGKLLTDLTIDPYNDYIYLQKLNEPIGSSGGMIYKIDTAGNILHQYESPANNYPVGLAYVDGNLIVGDREGTPNLYRIDRDSGDIIHVYENPCKVYAGPRGLTSDRVRYIYQVCTHFSEASTPDLLDAYLMRINKFSMETEYDRIQLDFEEGVINARGAAFDPETADIWVTSQDGDIFKIAGFNTETSVKETYDFSQQKLADVNIFPNPAREFSTISFKLNDISGNLTIDLMDVNGRHIDSVFDKYVKGLHPHVTQIECKGFSPGAYYLAFSLDGKRIQTEKFIILK